eukprot:Selendium_serpulae@DN5925_c2_g1_i2.p1
MERVSKAEGSGADFKLIGFGGWNTHVGGNGSVSRHADLPATTVDDETSRRATRRSSGETFVDVVDVIPGPALLERFGLKTKTEVCDNLPEFEVIALKRSGRDADICDNCGCHAGDRLVFPQIGSGARPKEDEKKKRKRNKADKGRGGNKKVQFYGISARVVV